MTAQILTHPARYRERIQDAQHWVWSLEAGLSRLRETDSDGVPGMGWDEWFAGTVTPRACETEQDMQDRAVADCEAALDTARAQLRALIEQAEAATKRPGGN